MLETRVESYCGRVHESNGILRVAVKQLDLSYHKMGKW